MFIPTFKPSIARKDMDSVLTCLVSENIGPGAATLNFQKNTAVALGFKGSLALRDFSRALEVCLSVLDIKPGALIGLSCLCPYEYLPVLKRWGCSPVFIDIDIDTGFFSSEALKESLAKGLDLLILHHHLTILPNELIASDERPKILEDISFVAGSGKKAQEKPFVGDLILMSLEENSLITAGGGAMILAQNRAQLTRIKEIAGELPESSALSALNASLGLAQIGFVEKFIKRRQDLWKIFIRALQKSRHHVFRPTDDCPHTLCSFPVLVKDRMMDVVEFAKKKRIQARPGFEKSILAVYPGAVSGCLAARQIEMRCLFFPLYPSLTHKEVDLISDILAALP